MSMGAPWARISRTSLSFSALPVTNTMDRMDNLKNMEQKFEVRGWKEGIPLPRRSDNIVLVSFGLWANGSTGAM